MAWAGPGVAVDSGTEDTPIVINSSSGEEEEEEEEEEREFRMHLSEVSGKCVYTTVEPLSNPDTNWAEKSVIVSEVSSFQRLKCMQEWYLGWEKVSCLERCPQFRSERGSM